MNDKKASCKTCVMCVPGVWAASQNEFTFPWDVECGAGYDEFPHLGHMCPHYQYQDNGYLDFLPIIRGNF